MAKKCRHWIYDILSVLNCCLLYDFHKTRHYSNIWTYSYIYIQILCADFPKKLKGIFPHRLEWITYYCLTDLGNLCDNGTFE